MKRMNSWVRTANGVLSFVAVTYIVFFFYYATSACVRNDLYKFMQPINEVTSYMFLFLGIIFLTVGVLMNISLSLHFPDFYANYKCLLWTATILLTCPLFIRSAKDYAYYHNEAFAKFYEAHFVLDNTLYAVLSTVLPVVTQTSSLVFGVMRQREDEKSKKKKQSNKQAHTHFLLAQGGSGEGGHREEDSIDDSSDDTESNVQIGYFDPPLEKFAFVSRHRKDDDTTQSNLSRSI